MVDEALIAAEPMLREAGFHVEREVDPGLPGLVGDPAALVRALRNLVENAVKYGGEDRRVAVRAQKTERGGRGYVRLEVEDRGLGIPAEDQKHLFEPFWRGREATARQIRGSGLGLSLVRSVVRAHGGDVLGQGASPGRVAFSRSSYRPGATTVRPRGRGTGKDMMTSRILLVEDEPGVRLTVEDRLRSEGYQVERAADGEEGSKRATSEPFDLRDPRRHAAQAQRLRRVPRPAADAG